MIEMTLVMSLLIMLVLGFVDFGYAFYQWNAAAKAVQVGARLAAVSTPVPVGLLLEAGAPASTSDVGQPVPAGQYHYRCTATALGVASCLCEAGTCANVTATQSAFDRIYYGDDLGSEDCGTVLPDHRPGLCDFFPGIKPEEARIDYFATGLGYWTRPGGPVPTISVRIVGHTFDFFFLGFANITMPDMLSTITGEDLRSTF
ncbi:TadE family protein [Devosia sp.]|uniref:TadE family protein n=1 Tax=Devosia sp. TaxID=1871048 RepID=UPI002F068AA9